MKIQDLSFKEKILNFLNKKVDLNNIKSIILAMKKDDGDYIIDFVPKQDNDFDFNSPLYKNKEMSEKELSGYENSSDIAVIHIDQGSNMQLSSDIDFHDMPFNIAENTESNAINFVIEDENARKHQGKIIKLPKGCKVTLDNEFITQTSYDVNGTLALVKRNAEEAMTIEEFISLF